METDQAIEILESRLCGKEMLSKEHFETLALAVAALKRQRWIPVSERLPEVTDGDYVLACVTWKDANIDYQNAVVMAFVSGEGLVDVELDRVLEGVTHWMPLPEPPKEGGKENAAD